MSIVTLPASEAFDVLYYNIPFRLFVVRVMGTASIFGMASGMSSIIKCNKLYEHITLRNHNSISNKSFVCIDSPLRSNH